MSEDEERQYILASIEAVEKAAAHMAADDRGVAQRNLRSAH
jgi:hypothetical protein